MSNLIEIHRPSESRGAFDADEHALRDKIYEAVIPQIQKERGGEHVAELVFHILNAPEEMLSEVELKIANDFRAKKHYSLSTGDIVVVDGEYFLCESFGWKKLENPIYPLVDPMQVERVII
jgi:hypothetical protein